MVEETRDGLGKFGHAHQQLLETLNKRLTETKANFSLPKNSLTGNYTMQEMSRFVKLSMKHIEGFDKMSLGSVQETIDKSQSGAVAKILTTVWDAAYNTNIGRQLVNVIPTRNTSVKIPKEGRMAWKEIAAGGGDGPRTQADYSFVTIAVKKYRAIVGIEDDMIADAEWGVVERQLSALGISYGEFETDLVVSGMVTGAGQTVTAAGTLTTAKVIEAWKKFARYSGGGYRTPTHLISSPEHYEDMTADTQFQNLLYHRPDIAGGDKVQGMVGFLPGNIQVLVHPSVPADTSILISKPYAAALVVRQDLNIEELDDPLNDLVRGKGTSRIGFGMVEANACVKIAA